MFNPTHTLSRIARYPDRPTAAAAHTASLVAVVREHGDPIFFEAGERDRAERVADVHDTLEGGAELVARRTP